MYVEYNPPAFVRYLYVLICGLKKGQSIEVEETYQLSHIQHDGFIIII